MRLIALAVLALSGCALFGPPLPPAKPRAETIELEARPAKAKTALVECARSYGAANGRADGVSAQQIVEAAMYACREQLEAYRDVAGDRAKTEARVLGFIDRSESRTEKAVATAVAEANQATMDALIRARAAVSSH